MPIWTFFEEPNAMDLTNEDARLESFIARWAHTTGSELANYQLFLSEFTALLDLPPPEPAADDNADNAYVFEHRVTLEHLKRLEGEVLEALADLGFTQQVLELEGGTVSPEKMVGLETNPRAALIAEAVLWIGYLQWHFRTFASTPPREPLLQDAHNIECRDAVLAWDDVEYVRDQQGVPVTHWDGRTLKAHPITGEQVPDEKARVPLEHYVNPRQALWPQADFVVGNPPFIGAKYLRLALGDGYTEALWRALPEVPESADYVMHWWYLAANLTRAEKIRRFGFITTNSLRQTFNRRVVQHQLQHKKTLSLSFAVPDHPWVDTADGAAVRIAMTVGRAGSEPGVLMQVIAERSGSGEGLEVLLREREGTIFSDLTVGADVAGAVPLASNGGISSPGVKLHGAGFIVTRSEADGLGLGRVQGLQDHIREYRNGRDLTATPRDVLVMDLYGLGAEEVRQQFPEVYQRVHDRVKPDRDQNRRASYRDNWWIFGEPRPEMRRFLSSIDRYVATVVTSKHRFFVSLGKDVLPDDALINVALTDPLFLGVLSSRVHCAWAFRTGATLEDRPRYIKTRCLETFPFPILAEPSESVAATSKMEATPKAVCVGDSTTPPPNTKFPNRGADVPTHMPRSTLQLAGHIRALALQIDAHRKRQQALHPGLTLTGIYNVLERLRQIAAASNARGSGAPAAKDDPDQREGAPPTPDLTAKERQIHEQGLVSVLAQLHDELDAAVLAAYGWEDLIPALVGKPGGTRPLADKPATQAAAEEDLLSRLVRLNAERAAEEARGRVRWLRPGFQNPDSAGTDQTGTDVESTQAPEPEAAAKRLWPKTLPEQFQAVREVLAAQPAPASAEQIARRVKRAQTKKVTELLQTLATLGQVQQPERGPYLA